MKRANAKTIKTITIDIAKCNGCRACEVICAASASDGVESVGGAL